MAFRAIVVAFATPGDVIQAAVEYRDESGKVLKTVSDRYSDAAGLRTQIRLQLQQFEAIDALTKNPPLTVGQEFTLADLLPAPAPEPTPAAVAEEAYRRGKADLLVIRQELDLGLVDQRTFDAKVAEVAALRPVIAAAAAAETLQR